MNKGFDKIMKNKQNTLKKEWNKPEIYLLSTDNVHAKTHVGHNESEFANIIKTGGSSYRFYTAGSPVAVATKNYNFVS
jgi:hypothetical protein